MSEGERGSIVIEAMIAALVIAAMAAALFETVGARAAEERTLVARTAALLIAQSRMAAVDMRAMPSPAVTRGLDGAYAWRVEISPFRADQSSAAGTLALVTVTVAPPGRAPLVTLRSLRLGR